VTKRRQIGHRFVDDVHRHTVIGAGQACARSDDIQVGQRFAIRAQVRGRLGHSGRQRFEDAATLAADLDLGHLQPVVQIDQRRGLHEHGLAGAGRVVHDAEAHRFE
jgi:hypothetical protein